MQRSGDEPLHKHSPTSLHLSCHDRERKELLLLVCWGSNPLTWMCKHATWFEPSGVYVIHERTRAAARCFLPIADTTCRGQRPHAWFRLFSSLQAISNDLHWWYGTEAGTWRALRLPGDRPLLCSCLRRRKVPQFTTAASGCLRSGCTRPAVAPLADVLLRACDHVAQEMWFVQKNVQKRVRMTTSDANSTIALFLSFQDAKKKDTLLSHTDVTAKDRNSLFF